MSGLMSGFDEALRSLASHLELPEPVRSRTLLELRGDLESMAAELERRGASTEEARDRALAALLPGPDALAELRSVHRPLYQRLVDRFSVAGRHRMERGFLGLLAAVWLSGGLAVLSRFDLLADPSPFLWPVLVGAVLVGVTGVGKGVHLWVLGARGGARRWVGLLPWSGALTLVAAFGATVGDLYGVAGKLSEDASRQLPVLLPWLQREMALLSVALLAASAAGVFWLVVAVRIARIEQAEAAALGFTEPGRNG